MANLIEENIRTDDPAFLYLNLHPGEEIRLIVRHHWAGFLGTLLMVAGMVVFPIILLLIVVSLSNADLSRIWPIIILFMSGFVMFLLTFLFGAWINFYYDILFITNKRVLNVDQKGLLSRGISELTHKQVQNVAAEVNGFLQTALGYGTLIIETAGGGTSDDPNKPGLQGYFTIHDLPDPNRLARIIIEYHHAATGEDSE